MAPVPKKKHTRSRSNIRRNTQRNRRASRLLQKARTSLGRTRKR